MYDHVKLTIRDVNPGNIILCVETTDLNSVKTSSQISRSIIDLAVSLKTNTNTITISLITPRNDHLNNNGSKVNNLLVNMCGERHISHWTQRNYSPRYLHKFGTIARYLPEPIFKMHYICNLISWNSMHVFDVLNCSLANINRM